jgi:DNA-binding NarL/FixJ family response regulator
MKDIPLLVKNDFEYLKIQNQINSLGNSSVNHALTAVAQEVAELLQHAYPVQADSSNHAEVITIRAIEPEYRQFITAEPLTERELEVLQLIVDEHNNSAIARKLYISKGTVKSHVRNILRKFCANDRT